MDIYQLIIVIIGSFIAGSINTLAGNGSAITLSILTELLGLPGNIANGTNRIGILAQTISSSWAFYRNGKLNFSFRTKIYIATMILGAILGVTLAINVSNEAFRSVFKYMIVVMLFVVLVKPSRWLQPTDNTTPLPWMLSIPLFLLLGFYGGFIQMGMGIFFLATMVLGAKYSLIDSNIVKSVVIALYTSIVLAIFHYKGLVDWKIGAIMAIGQTTGGYLTAIFAVKHPKSGLIAYILLVTIMIFVTIRLFFLT